MQTVLVTGASSGIGKATAARLAAAGFRVVATARNTDALHELAGCRHLALDVTDDASMKAAVDAVERDGGVDVLVNNAGYSQSGALETLPMDLLRKQFETNVFGAVRMAQLVLPGMRARGRGRIVNVSSMGGTFTFPGAGAYHASKWALESLSDALRFEVAGFGIDVIVVQPGIIRTGFSHAVVRNLHADTAGGDPYAAFNAQVGQLTVDAYDKGLIGRLGGNPDDVARVIERAIRARRPRTRYAVTPSAALLMAQRRWSTDRMWDAFLRTAYPMPGR